MPDTPRVEIIPVFPDRLVYKNVIRIGGTRYTFRFRYQSRCDRWYFDIESMEGEAIVRGIRVVTNWPLLRKYGDDRLPRGEIMCYRKDGLSRDPNRDELGRNALLLYFPDGMPEREEDVNLTFEIIE